MSALKYIAIAGAVGIGIVLVKRVATPVSPQVPSTPLGSVVSGMKDSLGLMKQPPATTPGSGGSSTGSPGVLTHETTNASQPRVFGTSPMGPLGASPFQRAATVKRQTLSTMGQPAYFTNPNERALAGVSSKSLYRVPSTVARR